MSKKLIHIPMEKELINAIDNKANALGYKDSSRYVAHVLAARINRPDLANSPTHKSRSAKPGKRPSKKSTK